MEGRQSIRVGTGIGCFSMLWCPWETRCNPHSRFKAPSSTPPTVCKYSLIQLPEAALVHPPAHEPSVTLSFLLGQVQGYSQLFPAFSTSLGPGAHLVGLPLFLISLRRICSFSCPLSSQFPLPGQPCTLLLTSMPTPRPYSCCFLSPHPAICLCS